MEAKIGNLNEKRSYFSCSNQNQPYFTFSTKHVGNDPLRKWDILFSLKPIGDQKVMLDGQSKLKADLTPEIIRRLYWEEKKSLPEIGKLYEIDSGSLYRWMERHKIPTRSKLEAGQLRKKLLILPDKLHELYWTKMMTSAQIGKLFGVSSAAVLHLMHKLGIQRRSLIQVGLLKTKAPSYESLYRLYISEGKSAIKIAKQLGVVHASVLKWLKKYKISVRSRSEACRKYIRAPFSGDGHPSKYAKRGTLQYEWALRCSLDQSFLFLLEKYKRSIPDWILEDDTTFYSFLAGYMDAEGCWMITKSHTDGIGVLFEIRSKDVKVLEIIKSELEKYDYHPTFGLCSGSLHFVRLSRCSEIRGLAKKLLSFSRHEEKIEKMQFILDIEKEKSWSKIRPKLLELKDKIRSQVLECVLKSGDLYKEKHGMEVMQL